MDNCILKHVYSTVLSVCLIVLLSLNVTAQNTESSAAAPAGRPFQVTGTVSDLSAGMAGVIVKVKGTSVAVSTNDNGEYSITVPNQNSVLEFRFIGYITVEEVVGTRKIISVQMGVDDTTLGEITIVAFGKQKKESVIGSVTTINTKELKRPTSNLTTTLAGNMAGIIAYQRSGEPGKDNADFFVRGITTFGTNTRPLILIDGVELTSTDLARLQPDDIASFSIMKDATATALYGARGANGVILVTTKQGNVGPAKISVRVENSFSMPTRELELADPVTYMKLYNEALDTRYTGIGNSRESAYTQEKIDNTIAGVDPVYYPSTDWQNALLKKFTTNQRANLSINGGGGVARYYVAASMNHDSGMFKVDKRNNFNNNISNNAYTIRANVNIDITKTTELAVRMSGVYDDYSGPINGGTGMYGSLMHTNPVLFPAYYEPDEDHIFTKHIMFGNYGNGGYVNPYADLVHGYKQQTRSQQQSQIEAKQNLKAITEGLSVRGMVNISRLSQFSVDRAYNPFYYKTSEKSTVTGKYYIDQISKGTEYLGYSENAGDRVMNSTFYFEGMANYDRTFAKKHSVSGLLVFTTRNSLNANTGTLQKSLPSRNVGLSGRTTYSYDSRYFGEFNFGYNGSERFHKSKRFGFFPSAGVAWMVSNEEFWKNIKPTISTLKLRYSYGKVGNDQIGSAEDRFFYLSEMNMNDGNRKAIFGENFTTVIDGVSVTRYANPNIGWEVATKKNYALELGLWDKITVIAEYFTEYRDHILMDRASIPTTMGLYSSIRANLGAASSKGFDMSVEYQQSFTKDFWVSARGNFTFARAKYEIFEEPAYAYPWLYRAGSAINQEYGYIAERLFIDDAEAANSPKQYVGTDAYGGGDIKYADLNGDGIIDEKDIAPIGNPTVPEIVYGFGFSVGYKGFDLSAFFQGQANQTFSIDAAETSPFRGETQMLKVYADNHWSQSNQDIYALWPRLSTSFNTNNIPEVRRNGANNGFDWVRSTYYQRNGNFMRLKQMEIGYTLPKKWKWQDKARLSNIRVYASGTNLLLFSNFKLWDVEMGGNGLGYPLQRVFNLGLNITFN